ncbi:hypothetical protein L8V23_01710 [Corynebacterium sp. c6VSa_13]|uniref:hypothetical protein n=1 Tax=Corynebacterium sp. c6VSa_13 TaxID=2913496 RepID=UPI0022BA3F51|nr:hypothetical protein [Corynebacterium sp. c6VSa_13]
MNGGILVVPGSPALIPELGARAVDENATRLVCAAREIIAAHGRCRIDIVGSRDERWRTGHEGSFKAWGAPDVTVSTGAYLPELVARWLLEPVVGDRQVREVRGNLGDPSPAEDSVQDVLTVVVIDGSAGMTPRAPLALREDAPAAHQWCRAVLGAQCPQPVTASWLADAGVVEPELWLEIAQWRRRHPGVGAHLLQEDVSQGVSRYVAWLGQQQSEQQQSGQRQGGQ